MLGVLQLSTSACVGSLREFLPARELRDWSLGRDVGLRLGLVSIIGVHFFPLAEVPVPLMG